MKKLLVTLITLLAALLMLPLIVSAQTESKIETGIMVGLNLSSFYGSGSRGTEIKTGIGGGGFVRFNVSPVFAIQPELLYSMKGAEGSELGFTFKSILTYVEIPVLLRVSIPVKGSVVPALFAGPVAGFNISSRLHAETVDGSITFDIDNARIFDFGLALGGGITVGTGKAKFFLDGRYTLGFKKAYKDVAFPGLFDLVDFAGRAPDVKNYMFSIMMGVSF